MKESRHFEFRITALTDVGKERDHNEDNYIINPNLDQKEWFFNNEQIIKLGIAGSLLVVADGMGGTNAGEVASEIAVKSVQEFFSGYEVGEKVSDSQIKKILREIILKCHKNIIEHAENDLETAGMGTTIVVGWIYENKLHVSWSGDSRAYIFRPNTGLFQVSRDHSYVQTLVDSGKLTKEQAFYHPEGNIITQSLGDKDHTPKPDYTVEELYSEDRILICSDGLSGMIQDHQIEEILRSTPDINECIRVLINEANKAGGHDNITAILCDVLYSPILFIPSQKSKRINPFLLTLFILIPILLFIILLIFKPFQKSTTIPESISDSIMIDTPKAISPQSPAIIKQDLKKEVTNPTEEATQETTEKEATTKDTINKNADSLNSELTPIIKDSPDK